MPYAIQILRDADKFLNKLFTRQRKDAVAIEDAIEDLSVDPRRHGCTPLTGYSDVFRLRVGNYRICYRIDDGHLVVLVITISTSDDVYKLLRRHLGH